MAVSFTGKIKIQGGPHLTFCQESRLIHAAGKGKKSCFSQNIPSYLKRFNLASTANSPCGNKNGTPLHYATESSLTASFYMTKPTPQHDLNVVSNKGSQLKIQRLLHHLNEFQELYRINQ
ncbi:hypothetical protein AVEN_193201-1 [Araneus ventricosus]|uniref:Uncharacterized protein n=1 Tax=Araneus ventricosus TaxID=182803 RepID=A0A4Y2B1P1_ARAVE|nr:hypothetical protein AVEN_193201-1 [Araneus ventricosus]